MSGKLSVVIQIKVSPLLNQALTSVPRYQGTSWSSQYARANRLVSISSTITLRWMGGLPSLPIQLPRHTIPVQAHIPFHNMTPRFEGDAQDRASDNTAYPSIVELQ
ncbi:hypothetical protein F5141DRAFT_1209666 [Pisolithus sp. B1]|nr:hypothetical protein F5141DRAFT_1209666 [Pisolithus sp. B1]